MQHIIVIIVMLSLISKSHMQPTPLHLFVPHHCNAAHPICHTLASLMYGPCM